MKVSLACWRAGPLTWDGPTRTRRAAGRAVVAVAALVAALAACSSAEDDDTGGVPRELRVGIIPNVSPERQMAQYEPFRQYLAEKLDRSVELFVATDYAGVVAAMVAKRVDVAYLGGLTYAQARQQAEVVPIVTEVDGETGTPKYISAVVVRKDSPHASLRDVIAAGGTFAFGDVSSTSGSLYPRMMLVDAGARCDAGNLSRCPPLRNVVFTGGHDAAAEAVINGSADAAGLELRILHRLERQGSVPAGALRVIEQREVMGYPWVAREGLSEEARRTITDAFLGITDPELLDLLRAKKYVTVTPEDYRPIREQAAALGLLTTG